MQKQKMVTTLLVAGMILASSFSTASNLAIAQVNHHRTTAKKQVVVVKKTTKKKNVVTASKTSKKTKVTKKKRHSTSRSRGGDPSRGVRIVEFAKTQLGKPYVWGSSGPYAFDCSGFTSYVFSNFGIYLPHNAASQSGYGATVSKNELLPGDLLFFETGGSRSINHVGIYIGNDSFIHGSSGKGKVSISDLSEYTKYAGVLVTAKRIL